MRDGEEKTNKGGIKIEVEDRLERSVVLRLPLMNNGG